MSQPQSRRSLQLRNEPRTETSTITNRNQPKNLYRHIIYKDAVFFPTQGDRLIESPIFSSLLLQKLMYFNIYYDFVYFYLLMVTFLYKLWVMDIKFPFHIVRPIILAAWAVLEAFRFRNGYIGNLKETFPDLFFFNLVTIGTICMTLANLFPARKFPIEVALEVIYIVLAFLQVIIGYYTMMKLSVSQEALFYLRSANSQIRMKREEKDTNYERRNDGDTSRLLKDTSMGQGIGSEVELTRIPRSPRSPISANSVNENRGPENRGQRRTFGGSRKPGYQPLALDD